MDILELIEHTDRDIRVVHDVMLEALPSLRTLETRLRSQLLGEQVPKGGLALNYSFVFAISFVSRDAAGPDVALIMQASLDRESLGQFAFQSDGHIMINVRRVIFELWL